MKSLPILAASAALFVGFSVVAGFSGAARAEMKPLHTIGHWKITANDNLCLASGGYQNGTLLSFSINAKGGAMISVKNPGWHIPKGAYEIVTQVDRATPQRVKATAEDQFLVFEFWFNEPTINLLSNGRTMFLTIGTQSFEYDLMQSGAMLKALIACAGPRLASANPFNGTAPQARETPENPFVETPSNPYRRM
jgi:hypothetical protein